MDTPIDSICAHQRRALDFMLDALGLPHAGDDAYRARLLELEQHVLALFRENRGLLLRVSELEHELTPDETELDALERAIDRRFTNYPKRHLDDI
jgi:hypothetical protein